jgi:hypothetical protein
VRIKLGKMLPDDLLRYIALDSLRSRVPGDDVPFGVEHKDRIVFCTIDQKAKHFVLLHSGS